MDEKGDEVLVKCSNCRAPLVVIWTTEKPAEKTKIIANCPHCDDASYVTEIEEKFYIGGTDFTSIESIEYLNEDASIATQIIKTLKVKTYE
tara:strand:- start:1856 stop:2128 length:273 start_codon:yes stop_codon:yes gene_type:complete